MFSFAGVKPFDGDGWGAGFTVTVELEDPDESVLL